MASKVSDESKSRKDSRKHTGTYDYHDDDCWCCIGGGFCCRDGRCWSCCGAFSKDSTCAGKGNKHHEYNGISSDHARLGRCKCRKCSPR